MQASARTPELFLTDRLGKSEQLPAQLRSQQSASPMSTGASYHKSWQNNEQTGDVEPYQAVHAQIRRRSKSRCNDMVASPRASKQNHAA